LVYELTLHGCNDRSSSEWLILLQLGLCLGGLALSLVLLLPLLDLVFGLVLLSKETTEDGGTLAAGC